MPRARLAKVVVYPGIDRHPWAAEAYDSDGHLRSRVTASPAVYPTAKAQREYVDSKIGEWWPDLPIEIAEPGKRPRG